MKIIFLDVDGVLNSSSYFKNRKDRYNDIDETRLPFLKNIIDSTGCKIVLSSSWRYGWSINYNECMDFCKEFIKILQKYNIEIMSSTYVSPTGKREEEIKYWLDNHDNIESFVILDDDHFDWEKYGYDKFWVKTSWYNGLGLNETDVNKAIQILNKKG